MSSQVKSSRATTKKVESSQAKPSRVGQERSSSKPIDVELESVIVDGESETMSRGPSVSQKRSDSTRTDGPSNHGTGNQLARSQDTSSLLVGRISGHISGPVRLSRLGGMHSLLATHAPYTAPAPYAIELPPSLRGARGLRVYEACSLMGALAGFMSCAWPLLWGSNMAPLYHSNVSTTMSGLGGFAAAGVGAVLGSLASLRLANGCAWLLTRVKSRPPLPTALSSTRLATSAATSSLSSVAGVRCPVDGTAGGAPAEIGISSARGGCRGCEVPVTSFKRPHFKRLLSRLLAQHPGAQVVAGGPAAMLSVLEQDMAAIGTQGELVRLTRSL